MLTHKIRICALLALTSFSSISTASLLDFEDSSMLGTPSLELTLGGGLKWSNIGGGHLYADDYLGDDYLYFSAATYINRFELNAMAWQGFDKGNVGLLDITALNADKNTVWSKTVDLSAYTDWNTWLSVTVETAGITQLTFFAPGVVPHINGFWPSLDNMTINEQAVPLPASAWLFASGILALAGCRRRHKRH